MISISYAPPASVEEDRVWGALSGLPSLAFAPPLTGVTIPRRPRHPSAARCLREQCSLPQWLKPRGREEIFGNADGRVSPKTREDPHLLPVGKGAWAGGGGGRADRWHGHFQPRGFPHYDFQGYHVEPNDGGSPVLGAIVWAAAAPWQIWTFPLCDHNTGFVVWTD